MHFPPYPTLLSFLSFLPSPPFFSLLPSFPTPSPSSLPSLCTFSPSLPLLLPSLSARVGRILSWFRECRATKPPAMSPSADSVHHGRLGSLVWVCGDVVLLSHSQEPIPTVESFLHILLEDWNGDDYRSEILQLMTHLSLQPFESMCVHLYSISECVPVCLFVRLSADLCLSVCLSVSTFCFSLYCHFPELEDAYLDPLKKLFVSKDKDFKV